MPHYVIAATVEGEHDRIALGCIVVEAPDRNAALREASKDEYLRALRRAASPRASAIRIVDPTED